MRQPQVGHRSFNTQPPEGGCAVGIHARIDAGNVSTHSHPKVAAPKNQLPSQNPKFQHTATRRWLLRRNTGRGGRFSFQHTATRRWLQRKDYVDGFGLSFQHTATRRWLPTLAPRFGLVMWFQHTATRRWLPHCLLPIKKGCLVSTHSHPKVAAVCQSAPQSSNAVSTHSHPKVAAAAFGGLHGRICRFNTQPPEGGCGGHNKSPFQLAMFQHTATRRWLQVLLRSITSRRGFNTQPPEGGCQTCGGCRAGFCRFNTQPPEGGCRRSSRHQNQPRRFNTQPPEGGCLVQRQYGQSILVSTHSHPKVAAAFIHKAANAEGVSTHSHPKVAAPHTLPPASSLQGVSTHSHPKVAALCCQGWHNAATRFNTQPPEGGCFQYQAFLSLKLVSTHSHPKVAAG